MKDKQGQMGGVGMLIIAAIAVIIGLIMFEQVAANVRGSTDSSTINVTNLTITMAAVNGITEITGQELVGTPILSNVTDVAQAHLAAANYTVYECVKTSNNLKGICVKTGALSEYAGRTVNISYGYLPVGYIDDAGTRSIALIIIILSAIAIAVVCIPNTRELFG